MTIPKRTPDLFRRRMGAAALIVSGGVLLSRILGQLREIVFAALLGANAVTDQYVAAFRLPDFLNYLLAGGFLSITFIPIFSRYLARGDEEGGWEAFTAIIRPIALGITALVAVGWILAPVVIDAIYPEFTAEQVANTVRLTRIVLPAQIFFVIGALFTAVQYAKGSFVIPTLAPIIYNLGIIGGGVGYAAVTGSPDPEGFIWGALVGAFVGNFAIQAVGARAVGMKLTRPEGGFRHPAVAEYLKIALPLMIGQSIVVLDETFMSVFGDLAGDGAQTQLLYARRTMFVPVGVIAQAAGVAAYPYLARLFAERKLTAMRDTLDRALRYVLVLSLAAAGLLAGMSVPIIRVLFERGNFEPTDTQGAASALFFYAFAVPIWGMLQLLTRGFYARRDMWTPVVVGSLATVVALPTYWWLQRVYGLEGVAVASVLALGVYTASLAALWYRGEAWRWRRVMDTAGRAIPLVVPASFAASGAASAVERVVGAGFVGSLLAVLAGTLVFAVVAFTLGGYLAELTRAKVDDVAAAIEPPLPSEVEALAEMAQVPDADSPDLGDPPDLDDSRASDAPHDA